MLFAKEMLQSIISESKKIVEDSVAAERAMVEEYMDAYKENRLAQLIKQKLITKGIEMIKDIFGDTFKGLEGMVEETKLMILKTIKDVKKTFIDIKKTCINGYNLVMGIKNELTEAG